MFWILENEEQIEKFKNKGDVARFIGLGNNTLTKGDFARIIAIAPVVTAAAPPAVLPGIANINSVTIPSMTSFNGVALTSISNINGVS